MILQTLRSASFYSRLRICDPLSFLFSVSFFLCRRCNSNKATVAYGMRSSAARVPSSSFDLDPKMWKPKLPVARGFLRAGFIALAVGDVTLRAAETSLVIVTFGFLEVVRAPEESWWRNYRWPCHFRRCDGETLEEDASGHRIFSPVGICFLSPSFLSLIISFSLSLFGETFFCFFIRHLIFRHLPISPSLTSEIFLTYFIPKQFTIYLFFFFALEYIILLLHR